MGKTFKLCVFALTIILVGCNLKHHNLNIKAISEEKLFSQGVKEIKIGEYKNSIKTLTKFEKEYYASMYYPGALILKAYSYYLSNNYANAIITVDDFLDQHPTISKTASYMYYIKGMSNYNQTLDIGRDQEFRINAKKNFEILVNAYPHSKYANDVKWRLVYIGNTLAEKEMDVGRFYMKNNKPISSINRFKTVIEKYQTSIFTPEALYRLIEVYQILGVEDQVKNFVSVLGHNYQKSHWYNKSYRLLNSEKK